MDASAIMSLDSSKIVKLKKAYLCNQALAKPGNQGQNRAREIFNQ
jgi:hypothetical protein